MDLTCIECFVATGCQNNSVRWATDLEGGQWDLCVFFSPNILSQRPRCKWCVYVCVCVRREVGVAVGVCGTGGTELQQCRRRPIGMWHAANHTQHLPKGEKDRKWEIESEVYKYINTYIYVCMFIWDRDTEWVFSTWFQGSVSVSALRTKCCRWSNCQCKGDGDEGILRLHSERQTLTPCQLVSLS